MTATVTFEPASLFDFCVGIFEHFGVPADDARLAYGTEDGRHNLESGTPLKAIVDNVFDVHGRRIPNLGAR